jgi:hypothetical protein
MIFADICVNPTKLILDQLTGKVYEFASYYFDCTGTDPIASFITTAQNQVVTAQNTVSSDITNINTLYPTCSAGKNICSIQMVTCIVTICYSDSTSQ